MDLVVRQQNPGCCTRIAQPFPLLMPSPQHWEAMKRAGATTEHLGVATVKPQAAPSADVQSSSGTSPHFHKMQGASISPVSVSMMTS